MQGFLRLFWVHRFRLYAIITICLFTPLLYSSNINIKSNITAIGYTVTSSNLLAQKIEYNKLTPTTPAPKPIVETKPAPEAKVKFDFTPQDIMDQLKASLNTFQSGFINTTTLKDLNIPLPAPERIVEVTQKEAQLLKSRQGKLLDDIYPRPPTAARKNFITIPDYNVNAPLLYATFEDFFVKKADGSFDYDGKPRDLSDRFKSPIQLKLRDGVVCLPFSPFPGELGNSYCLGHSNNYPDVVSDYNDVFKPIEKKGKVGELIKVFDPYGRELTFRIFETEIIESNGAQKAYLPFPDHKRVITLQTSVVSTRNGKTEVFQRWLVKAELICPGGEVCKE